MKRVSLWAGALFLLAGTVMAVVEEPAEDFVPTPESRFLRYAESPEFPPHFVFDTIAFWHDGKFHLFFLNADHSLGKQGACWSHAVTADFVHWEKLPDAIRPNKQGIDANCWTGSVIEKDGVFYLFYTGKDAHDGSNPDPKGDQKVMLAISKDLVHFEKQPNFTFYADGKIYWNKTINGPFDPKLNPFKPSDEGFRDPEVFWNPAHGEYWMLLHARSATTQQPVFGVYTSDDLLDWTPREPLEMASGVSLRRNIDCPDLFEINGTWYLINSGSSYLTAQQSEGPFGKPSLYEFQTFVSKTTRDDQGRILTTGTARSPRSKGQLGGRASIVREFYQGPQGELLLRPLPEVVSAFATTTHTLASLKGRPTTPEVEIDEEGTIRFSRIGSDNARVFVRGAPVDFLADFTVRLGPGSTFRFNFRGTPGGAIGNTLEISTAKDDVWLGTPRWNTNSNIKDRGITVPADTPIRVQLFAVGDFIECFIEDVCAFSINDYSFRGSQVMLESIQGNATVEDFALRTVHREASDSPRGESKVPQGIARDIMPSNP